MAEERKVPSNMTEDALLCRQIKPCPSPLRPPYCSFVALAGPHGPCAGGELFGGRLSAFFV